MTEELKKDIKSILIVPGDFPPENVAGEFKLIAGNEPILHNFDDAELMAIQWIGHFENQAEIGGEVTLYLYPSHIHANSFFTRFTREFDGNQLSSIGNECLIYQEYPPIIPVTESTSIRFRRNQFVIAIRGWANDDPSFARSKLTKDVLKRYAKLLDKRILEIDEERLY